MSIEVAFWGLCSIVLRKNATQAEAYLPVGHTLPNGTVHMGHIATLAVPVKQIDLKATSWKPTMVVHDGETQIGCWKIEPKSIVELGAASAAVNWTNPSKSIQFWDVHTLNSLDRETLNKNHGHPVVLFGGGSLTGGTESYQNVKFPKEAQKSVPLAKRVIWQSQVKSLEISYTGPKVSGSLVLKEDARATVTNVADEIGVPNEHFSLYYSLINGAVAEPIIYEPDMKVRDFAPNVYDCVPPTGGS